MERCAPARVESSQSNLRTRAGRLSARSASHVDRVAEQLAAWRRLLAAYNVENQLRRGYRLPAWHAERVLVPTRR